MLIGGPGLEIEPGVVIQRLVQSGEQSCRKWKGLQHHTLAYGDERSARGLFRVHCTVVEQAGISCVLMLVRKISIFHAQIKDQRCASGKNKRPVPFIEEVR